LSWLAESLEGAEQAQAAEVLEQCPTVVLHEGTSHPAARLPNAEFLLVEEGIVLVTRLRPGATRRMILAVVGAGAVLTPPAIDDRLEVLAPTWLTALTPPAREALLKLPGAATALTDGLAAQLGDAFESLGHFASVRHVERVREKLLQLARTHGRVVPGGIRLDLPLTHELLGEMIGSARETVTWAVAQLAREGFLSREGRSYRLAVSPEALAS
jgi:CRP-like cAMP-binding protein